MTVATVLVRGVGQAVRRSTSTAEPTPATPKVIKRDLRATTDLRAVFKTVLAGHLAVPESALETRIFPDSRAVRPLDGLLRA